MNFSMFASEAGLAHNQRTGAAGGAGDVASRLIEHAMIESLQANPDILRFHGPTERKTDGPLLKAATRATDQLKSEVARICRSKFRQWLMALPREVATLIWPRPVALQHGSPAVRMK